MTRHDSYWWHGSLGRNDANGWPVWFIEWGGRGHKRYGAPLLAIGWPWRGKRVMIRTW